MRSTMLSTRTQSAIGQAASGTVSTSQAGRPATVNTALTLANNNPSASQKGVQAGLRTQSAVQQAASGGAGGAQKAANAGAATTSIASSNAPMNQSAQRMQVGSPNLCGDGGVSHACAARVCGRCCCKLHAATPR